MKNPFQFGRELAPPDLVDRQDEIATCVRTVQNHERLFVIGPRRYGKTSILKAASETLQHGGAIVFRYSAEAYPTFEMLVSAWSPMPPRSWRGATKRPARKCELFLRACAPK